jgi:hypothetical protein
MRPGAKEEAAERVPSWRLSRVTGFFAAGSNAAIARRNPQARATDDEELRVRIPNGMVLISISAVWTTRLCSS